MTTLNAYLDRIGYTDIPQPDWATLKALHRAHLLAIPYENLDIHLGRYLTLDETAIIEKIVMQRRGGWCYEMNGLFAWALRQIGFEVSLLASNVGRHSEQAAEKRDHLILRVDLDLPYLADVGFGNGFLEPLPLIDGLYQQGFLSYLLEQDDQRWYFHNHAYATVGYDFTLAPFNLPDFTIPCHTLQTSPESGFVRTTVCHRFVPEGIITLKGAVLRTVTAEAIEEIIMDTEANYEKTLTDLFDLHLPAADVAILWAGVWQRHLAWVAAEQ
jgi:N-hydroxyarylamine O-acetyltransferase